MSAQCRSCEKPIRWVKLAVSGRFTPIEPEPSAGGTIVLLATRDSDGTQLARVIGAGDGTPETTKRYLSHFATCPHAAAHRTRV